MFVGSETDQLIVSKSSHPERTVADALGGVLGPRLAASRHRFQFDRIEDPGRGDRREVRGGVGELHLERPVIDRAHPECRLRCFVGSLRANLIRAWRGESLRGRRR